jgi:four helix bundle protein
VTTIIYDATVAFCDRFISGRTHDQMVQAARSGRQNIAEGNRAGGTSSKSELHLTNVARASLEELLLDFEDYLRQRRLPQWTKDSQEAKAIRAVGWRRKDPSHHAFTPCPLCGKPMPLRTARQGKNSGKQFWGCTGYPDCKGAATLDP